MKQLFVPARLLQVRESTFIFEIAIHDRGPSRLPVRDIETGPAIRQGRLGLTYFSD
ncbi:MAG TPA: hypothetical protein VFH91_04615 [Pyrinomonadaceae bacterium]|nr:hypothetical protein [Pyrinomonadaceae bacterium]